MTPYPWSAPTPNPPASNVTCTSDGRLNELTVDLTLSCSIMGYS